MIILNHEHKDNFYLYYHHANNNKNNIHYIDTTTHCLFIVAVYEWICKLIFRQYMLRIQDKNQPTMSVVLNWESYWRWFTNGDDIIRSL